jgi:polar amino acid transport system substrate-binding protein
VRRGSVVLTAWFVLLLAATAAAQSNPARSLVYGGDQQFPPYEYLDDEGRPEGFNIHLIRALAR